MLSISSHDHGSMRAAAAVTAIRPSAENTETRLTGGHRNSNVRVLMIVILLIRGRNWNFGLKQPLRSYTCSPFMACRH
jgi:hypothetical protein